MSAEKDADLAAPIVFNAALNRNKTEQQRQLLSTAITNNVLFKSLDSEQLKDIVDEMHMLEVKAGTALIKQGSVADNFYVVESGEFDVSVAREDQAGGKPQV